MFSKNLLLFLFGLSELLAYPAFAGSPIPSTLGRIFYTPEQRQVLSQEQTQPKHKNLSTNIRLNGIVKPSKGQATIWINGIPYYAQSPVTLKDTTSVSVPIDQQYVTLKVGEEIHTEE